MVQENILELNITMTCHCHDASKCISTFRLEWLKHPLIQIQFLLPRISRLTWRAVNPYITRHPCQLDMEHHIIRCLDCNSFFLVYYFCDKKNRRDLMHRWRPAVVSLLSSVVEKLFYSLLKESGKVWERKGKGCAMIEG